MVVEDQQVNLTDLLLNGFLGVDLLGLLLVGLEALFFDFGLELNDALKLLVSVAEFLPQLRLEGRAILEIDLRERLELLLVSRLLVVLGSAFVHSCVYFL